jgi:hypothetical protein
VPSLQILDVRGNRIESLKEISCIQACTVRTSIGDCIGVPCNFVADSQWFVDLRMKIHPWVNNSKSTESPIQNFLYKTRLYCHIVCNVVDRIDDIFHTGVNKSLSQETMWRYKRDTFCGVSSPIQSPIQFLAASPPQEIVLEIVLEMTLHSWSLFYHLHPISFLGLSLTPLITHTTQNWILTYNSDWRRSTFSLVRKPILSVKR